MTGEDEIEGKQIAGFLAQLEKEKTVLKLSLPGKGYERLTIVTGILPKEMSFRIDYPDQFAENMEGKKGNRLYFELTGKDKIRYNFRAEPQTIRGREILIKFPDCIKRIQRRRYFRISAPIGSRVEFRWNQEGRAAILVDISEGGGLIQLGRRLQQQDKIAEGDELTGLHLICGQNEGRREIRIERARVIRLEKDPGSGKLRLGLEFTEVDQNGRATLAEFIFSYQREILRRKRLSS